MSYTIESNYPNSGTLSTDKKNYCSNTYEGRHNTVEYRSIPVLEISDSLKTPGIFYENVSGVKDVNLGDILSSSYYARNNSTFGAKSRIGIAKKSSRAKLDTTIALNTMQRKLYSDYANVERSGQGSHSEPALTIAKDRGDSIPLQDTFNDENLLVSKTSGDGKSMQSKDEGIKGYMYIKAAGKVYESRIEAVNLQTKESDLSSSARKGQNIQSFGNAASKNRRGNRLPVQSVFGTNSIKFGSNEGDEFEIAIYLSGFKNLQREQNAKAKQTEYGILGERSGKKKKRKVKGKSYSAGRPMYNDSSKTLKFNTYRDSSSRLTCAVNKSNAKLEFSSKGSDSYEYDVFENILKQKNTSSSICSSKRETVKSFNSSLQSRRNRARLTSASSIAPYVPVYEIPKPKVSNRVLWEKFEIVFRNYASTSRHSGEVIPRKISTQWMRQAGILDELLTEEAADFAFRSAAGTKITMNSREYKEFLIMISLQMKLPCYEIYRRMCGM